MNKFLDSLKGVVGWTLMFYLMSVVFADATGRRPVVSTLRECYDYHTYDNSFVYTCVVVGAALGIIIELVYYFKKKKEKTDERNA